MADLAVPLIAQPLQLLIGDSWVNAKSGKTFVVFDLATGLPSAKAADGDAPDTNLAVATADAAFDYDQRNPRKPRYAPRRWGHPYGVAVLANGVRLAVRVRHASPPAGPI